MSAPRALQPSFAKGEISPMLHVRVDLASYPIGLRYQLNMITLPQGGFTRRPGFNRLGPAAVTVGATCPVRLVRFVYNREDAMMIELSEGQARIWRPSTRTVVQTIAAPYALAHIHEVKFIQSGNVIFLTHRDYPIQQLTRNALDDWTIEPFGFREGPWAPLEETDGVQIVAVKRDDERYNLTAYDSTGDNQVDYWTPDMVGSLISISYTIESVDVEGESLEEPAEYVSESVEVGGTWYLRTYDKWKGRVILEKSVDGGDNWISVEDRTRDDPDAQGNYELSGAETESNVIYRVRAQHQAGSGKMRFILTAAGYRKSYNLRIVEYVNARTVIAEWLKDDEDISGGPITSEKTSDWRLGAWSGKFGFPGAIGMFQDRLMLAGNWRQPNTEWGSRTGDYANFGVSDPIQDDDAINVNLSSQTMDGVHSLVALNDLLAFTPADVWRTKGAGDNGAITPTAIAAHMQTNFGAKDIQPLVIGNAIVYVDTHGVQVQSIGYSLEYDGYTGGEISLFSSHLFQWLGAPGDNLNKRVITKMAYQRVPDSLLWFVLADGTAVSCTLQMDQQLSAWARHETDGRFGDFEVIPAEGYDELWAVVERDGEWGIEVMAPRAAELLFADDGRPYESCVRTLRLNYDSGSGSVLSTKKLPARVTVYTVRSREANIAPVNDRVRRRSIKWTYSAQMEETDVQLDTGFAKDAALEIWTDSSDPLTILGISPSLSAGG